MNLLLQAKEIHDSLLLSDAADFGCLAAAHAKKNLKEPFRKAKELQFQGVPAILVGAGPSLEKNGHLLSSFRDKALIFAGGHALEKIPIPPHFGACIDKDRPILSLKYPEVPLCFQARMHPENFSLFQGERLLVPDGHFSFINHLSSDEDLFDGGWTVGNCMVALALHFGCNPIVCVGMDYCYQEGRRYAFSSKTEEISQPDWELAVHWMHGVAYQNPKTTFINATEGGVPYFELKKLSSLHFEKIPHLQEKVELAISKLPKTIASFSSWEEHLRSQSDVVSQKLLFPLWRIWEPLFKKEGFSNMELHQHLFFQRIIQEHLDVCLLE